MSFEVLIMNRAKADFASMSDYLAERSAAGAAAWGEAFYRALDPLKSNPFSCSLAPEDEDHDAEIRQFFFKTRRGRQYRGLITVTGQTVHILHLRGPGQDVMDAGDVRIPE